MSGLWSCYLCLMNRTVRRWALLNLPCLAVLPIGFSGHPQWPGAGGLGMCFNQADRL